MGWLHDLAHERDFWTTAAQVQAALVIALVIEGRSEDEDEHLLHEARYVRWRRRFGALYRSDGPYTRLDQVVEDDVRRPPLAAARARVAAGEPLDGGFLNLLEAFALERAPGHASTGDPDEEEREEDALALMQFVDVERRLAAASERETTHGIRRLGAFAAVPGLLVATLFLIPHDPAIWQVVTGLVILGCSFAAALGVLFLNR